MCPADRPLFGKQLGKLIGNLICNFTRPLSLFSY